MFQKISIQFTTMVLTCFLSLHSGAQQWEGLTLYSNMNSSIGYLVDTAGTTVKTWTFTGGNTGYSTHMMPGGFIYRSVRKTNSLTGGGMTGGIQKLDYNGNVLWDYTYSSSTYCLHHDHCPLPNGNVLVISYDVKTAAEATAAGSNSAIVVWSEKIMELQPVGTNSAIVVWEWKLWDHLVQNVNPNGANYQASIVDNPQLLNINYKTAKDWIHMNGVDYNPMLDQIALSSHNINEWYIIDHSTTTAEAAGHSGGRAGKGGDFLYRWGNPAAYGAGGSTILNVTHDAHWVPENCPSAGNLAGVNNKGVTSPSTKTTADEIVVPRNGLNYTITSGSAFTPASYSTRHTSTGYTSNMGSTEQFPNGNQMICLATAGTIYEIDASGNVLWTKSTGGTTPQAHRYSLCYINNSAPVQPSISISGSVLSTASAASYQWYRNGDKIQGATGQNYTVSQSGFYVVRTTDANACVYAYSPGYNYTVTVDETGLHEQKILNGLMIWPNPANQNLAISFTNETPGNYVVSLKDLSGKLLLQQQNATELQLSDFSEGIYLLNVLLPSGDSVNKKVIINR